MPDGSQTASQTISQTVEFRIQTPLDDGSLPPRMAANDARGLPEAVRVKTAIIVGSGPSARHAALWERLAADDQLVAIACNGALSLFTERGLAPTYWACCDPQDCVLDFVNMDPAPPPETTYLLATKCPPALFDALAWRSVRTWRLDDMAVTPGKVHLPCAVSITLVTMNLARMMGYNRFELYGWDCCYLDGEHHASDQPEPTQPMPFEIQYEDGRPPQCFDVCGAWAAELNDAVIQAHNYRVMGYEIVVHGPGAVGALLRAKGLIA